MPPETESVITTEIAIPEELHGPLQRYLDNNPKRSLDDVATMALSLFLLQNGEGFAGDYKTAVRIYARSLGEAA